MKKLLCIKQGEWKSNITGKSAPGPVYMEECQLEGIKSTNEYYYLVGYNIDSPLYGRWAYNPDHFIEINTNINELELVNELVNIVI